MADLCMPVVNLHFINLKQDVLFLLVNITLKLSSYYKMLFFLFQVGFVMWMMIFMSSWTTWPDCYQRWILKVRLDTLGNL